MIPMTGSTMSLKTIRIKYSFSCHLQLKTWLHSYHVDTLSHISLHDKSLSLIFSSVKELELLGFSLFALQTPIILIGVLRNVTTRIRNSSSWL